MKAVSYEGPRKVSVSKHPKPKIKSPTGSVFRLKGGSGVLYGRQCRRAAAEGGAFPPADFFDKAVSMGSGHAPVKKYNGYLRDLISTGKAKPSQIVSHRIDIKNAPEAYDKFGKQIEGYTKILSKFEPSA